MPLSTIIADNMDQICKTLFIGRANFDVLVERASRCERGGKSDFYDEQVWTFLLAASYAIAGDTGATKLGSLLTETADWAPTGQIWFEFLPIPPRREEGNTNLDLALGAIARRARTQSGIEYAPERGDAICFCEFKWYSDMSIDVSYDRHRNQLARVIENGLCFQRGSDFPKSVHVTLVTRAVFVERATRSRLYQYKFPEYQSSQDLLISELEASRMNKRTERGFRYPDDFGARVRCLSLHWVTFQSLCAAVPESPLKEPFQEFVSRFDGTGKIAG